MAVLIGMTGLEDRGDEGSIMYVCMCRAAPDCKLGFQRQAPHLVPLTSASTEGGLLPATVLVIQRIFPVLYMSIDSGGVRTPRTAHAHERAAHVLAARAEEVSSCLPMSCLQARHYHNA